MIDQLFDWPSFIADYWGRRPMHTQRRPLLRAEDFHDFDHLEDAHRRSPVLATLCAALEERLSHPVRAGVHRTRGPGAAGCETTADLIVLTVSGERTYTVEPEMRADLRVGDVLYIPKGHRWTAEATAEETLHVVLRISVLTMYDLLSALVEVHARDARPLRQAVKLGDGDAQRGLDERLALVTAAPRLAEAAAHLATRFVSASTVAPDGHFAALYAGLEADTPLRRRTPAVAQVTDLKATIVFGGNAVSGPPLIGPALHFIASRETFRPDELPGLSVSAGLLLSRRLLQEGLLRKAVSGE